MLKEEMGLESSWIDENDNFTRKEKEETLSKIEKWMTEKNYFNNFNSYKNLNKKHLEEFALNLWEGCEIGVDFSNLDKIKARPDWLDLEMLKAGQEFAEDFYASVCSSEIICLLLILANDNVLRKLVWTGKSSDTFTSFKRYFTTGQKVRSWLVDDLFDQNSPGYKHLKVVNQMHASFFKKLEETEYEEFRKSSELAEAKSCVCPFMMEFNETIDCPLEKRDLPTSKTPMTQTEMTGTQFSFLSLLILEPEKFGICPVKYAKGLEGFVHLWRYLAYRLGTLDKYNLCTGSYDDVKAKSRLFLDFAVKPNLKKVNARWEHMTRCIIDGLHFYTDCFTYETHLMFGLEIINVKHKQLYHNSSYRSRLQLYIMRLLNKYLIPYTWFRRLINTLLLWKVNKILNNMPTQQEFLKKIK